MRHLLLSIVFVIAGAAFLGNLGCAPMLGPLYAPQTSAGVNQAGEPYSAEQIEQAILRGAAAKNWIVKEHGPQAVIAETSTGGHTAVVRIVYGPGSWQILHESSSPGLKYANDPEKGEVIHRRYNHWIRLLDEAIRKELLTSTYAPQAAPAAASTASEAPPAAEAPATP